MRALGSAIVLGIGFLMVSGSPARAQLGGLGEAAQKGAADAVKQEVMKGAAEQAGVPVGGTPAVTPAAAEKAAAPTAEAGAASTPAEKPTAAAAAADTPPAPAGATGETMTDKARQKAMEEGSKKMMPKLP